MSNRNRKNKKSSDEGKATKLIILITAVLNLLDKLLDVIQNLLD